MQQLMIMEAEPNIFAPHDIPAGDTAFLLIIAIIIMCAIVGAAKIKLYKKSKYEKYGIQKR